MPNSLKDALNKLEKVDEETLRFSCPSLVWDFSSLQNFFAWDITDQQRKTNLFDVFNVRNDILVNRSHAKISDESATSPYSIYKKTSKNHSMSRVVFNSLYDSTFIEVDHKDAQLSDRANDIISILNNANLDRDLIIQCLERFVIEPRTVPQNLPHYVGNSKEEFDAIVSVFDEIYKFIKPDKHNGIDEIRKILSEVAAFIYYDKEANDIDIETKFAYQKVSFEFYNDTSNLAAMIICPDPFFIKKWLYDKPLLNKKKQVIFVVSNKYLISFFRELSKALGNDFTIFIEIKDVENHINTTNQQINHVLFFANKIEKNNDKVDILSHIIKYSDVNSLYILDSDGALKNNNSFGAFINENLNVNTIDMFPSRIINSTTPASKMMYECSKKIEKNKTIRLISFTLYISTKNNQALNQSTFESNAPVSLLADPIQTPRSYFDSHKKSHLIKDKNKKLFPARFVNFSNELTIKYSYSYVKTKKDSFDVFAYFVDDNEKIIASKHIDTIYKEENIEPWVLNVFPYMTKRNSGNGPSSIRLDLVEYYKKESFNNGICLKTLYYLNPQIDDDYSSSDIEYFRLFLNSDFGNIDISKLTNKKIDSYIDDVCVGENALAIKSLMYEFVSDLIIIAKKKRYISDQIDQEKLKQNRKAYNVFSKISANLAQKSFSMLETIRIFNVTKKHYDKGEKEYLGVIICLILGLDYKLVSALHWDNYLSIKTFDGYNFHQLQLYRRMDYDGIDYEQFDDISEYRVMPCPRLLEGILESELKELKDSNPKLSKNDLSNTAIVRGKETNDKGEWFISPKSLSKLCRSVLKEAKIKSELIIVPDKKNGISEKKLSSYINIFRNNYRHQLLHRANCTDGEIAYLLGNKAPDTFSNNYCDYENDSSQFILFLKEERYINSIFSNDFPKYQPDQVSQNEYIIRSDRNNLSNTLISFETDDSNANVEMSGDFGFDIAITKFGGNK